MIIVRIALGVAVAAIGTAIYCTFKAKALEEELEEVRKANTDLEKKVDESMEKAMDVGMAAQERIYQGIRTQRRVDYIIEEKIKAALIRAVDAKGAKITLEEFKKELDSDLQVLAAKEAARRYDQAMDDFEHGRDPLLTEDAILNNKRVLMKQVYSALDPAIAEEAIAEIKKREEEEVKNDSSNQNEASEQKNQDQTQ